MARVEVLEGKPTGNEPKDRTSDFRLEYGRDALDEELLNDIVSYLGEYRFKLPKFLYKLEYSDGKLRNQLAGKTMQSITQKTLDSKIAAGNSYFRELAENKGIVSLDKQLNAAKDAGTVVWASPPGPKEEGYGDYGFIFTGNIKLNHLSEKTVQMTAIRLENPKIEQFNNAIHLLTGEKTDYKKAEEFIANPRIAKEHLPESYIDAILKRCFSFMPNEDAQRRFELIIQEMFPLIMDFVKSVKDPWKTRGEKRKEFYSLENYALKLKKDHEGPLLQRANTLIGFKDMPRLPDIVGKYGFEPPKVAGSCPANNNKNSLSSNIFSKGSILNDLFESQEWFHCPKCGFQADGPVGDTCPNCKLTKEEYAQETGISCD